MSNLVLIELSKFSTSKHPRTPAKLKVWQINLLCIVQFPAFDTAKVSLFIKLYNNLILS